MRTVGSAQLTRDDQLAIRVGVVAVTDPGTPDETVHLVLHVAPHTILHLRRSAPIFDVNVRLWDGEGGEDGP